MFFLTKLLAFLPFGNLLRGTSLKIILIIGAILVVAFVYWKWKDNIRTAVYKEIFQEQVVNQLEEQEREFKRLQAIIAAREAALQRLLAQQKELAARYERVLADIQRGEYDTGEVSEVLRVIVDQIRRTELGEPLRDSRPVSTPPVPQPKPEQTGNASIDAWRNAQ